MAKYILELTESQEAVLQLALDLYGRIGMGQLHEILHHIDSPTVEAREDAEKIISQLKGMLMGLHGHSHYGISSDKMAKRFKMALEMHDCLRSARAWHDHPEGGITVDFDPPMNYSGEPLPEVNIKEEGV